MAETGYTRLPVVARGQDGALVGLVSLEDLLKARGRTLEAERRREHVLPMHLFFPPRAGRLEGAADPGA
jgi:CBS domain-containing protein